MSIEVLDPTHESDAARLTLAARLDGLEGARVGIISNGKEGTKGFFDAFDKTLREVHGVAEVVRFTKPNYSAPAGAEILARAAGLDALVAGIGD